MTTRWEPDLPAAERRILLLMPCTKTKPYPFSSEHRAINQRLDDEGFPPIGHTVLPQELQARLPEGFSQKRAGARPARRRARHRRASGRDLRADGGGALRAHRHLRGPRLARDGPPYDDPGLFENRGNAVSPWRADSTAEAVSATRWRWGDEEKRAYVAMHNAMAEGIAATFARVGRHFTDRIAWVAPGLTHRSFLLAADERRAHGVPRARVVAGERLTLVGANDLLPDDLRISCLPSVAECDVAKVPPRDPPRRAAVAARRRLVPAAASTPRRSRCPNFSTSSSPASAATEPVSAAATTQPAARPSL